MNKIFLFLLLPIFGFAQNIQINNSYNLTFCGTAETTINFYVSVQPTGNTFDILLSNAQGSFASGTTVLKTVTTQASNYVNSLVAFPANTVASNLYKIKAVKGTTGLSNEYPVIYNLPDPNLSASISGTYSKQACAYNAIEIPITLAGNSTEFTISYEITNENGTYSNSTNQSTIYYYDSMDATIRLTSISNGCETVSLNSVVNVELEEITTRFEDSDNLSICQNEEFEATLINNNSNCNLNFYLIIPGTAIKHSINAIYSDSVKVRFLYNSNIAPASDYRLTLEFNGIPIDTLNSIISILEKPEIDINSIDTNAQNNILRISGKAPYIMEINNSTIISETDSIMISQDLGKKTIFNQIRDSNGCNNFSRISLNKLTDYPELKKVNISKVYLPINHSNYNAYLAEQGNTFRVDYDINENVFSKKFVIFFKNSENSFFVKPSRVEDNYFLVNIPNETPVGHYNLYLESSNKSEDNYSTLISYLTVINKTRYFNISSDTLFSAYSSINIPVESNYFEGGPTTYASFFKLFYKESNSNIVKSSESFFNNGLNFSFQAENSENEIELISLVAPFDTLDLGNMKISYKGNIFQDNNIKFGYSNSDHFYTPIVCDSNKYVVPVYPLAYADKIDIMIYNSNNDIIKIIKGNLDSPGFVNFKVEESFPLNNFRIRPILKDRSVIGRLSYNSLNHYKSLVINANLELNVVKGQVISIPIGNNSVTPDILEMSNGIVSSFVFASNNQILYKVPLNSPDGIMNLTLDLSNISCGIKELNFNVQLNVVSNVGFALEKDKKKLNNEKTSTVSLLSSSQNLFFENEIIDVIDISSINGFQMNLFATFKNGKIYFNSDLINSDIVFYSKRLNIYSNVLNKEIIDNPPYIEIPIYDNIIIGYSKIDPGISTIKYGNGVLKINTLEDYQKSSYTFGLNEENVNSDFLFDQTCTIRIFESETNNSFEEYSYHNDISRIVHVKKLTKNLKIEKVQNPNLCNNQTIKLEISELAPSINPIIQIRELGTLTYVDIPTTRTGNVLNGTVPTNLNKGRLYGLKVKYTLNSSTEYSNPSPIHFKPFASATGIISGGGTINASQTISQKLVFDFTGTGPFTCTYTDGLNNFTINTVENHFEVYVKPQQSTTYTIVSLTNSCTSGTFSGSAVFNVRSIMALSLTNLGGKCTNQSLEIPFESFGNFNAGNTFKIELLEEGNATNNYENKYYLLNTTITGNLLIATLPNTLPISDENNVYQIRVVSTAPELKSNFVNVVGTNTKNTFKNYGAIPTVSFGGSTTISQGQTVPLTVNVNGNSDYWYFKLNNGQSSSLYYPAAFPYDVNVSPNTTTTYSLTEFNTSCGNIINSPLTITLNVSDCAQSLTLSNTVSSGTEYHKALSINSINKVETTAKLELIGAKEVILTPGFESKNGSIFKAEISPCANN